MFILVAVLGFGVAVYWTWNLVILVGYFDWEYEISMD
jgi:hypothetical protein